MQYTDNNLSIRTIEEKDLPRLWELIFKEEKPEWKKWDAPYFPHQAKSYEAFLTEQAHWINSEKYWAVELDGHILGTISYYWEHQPSCWLEIGIVLHEAASWGKGIGTRALKLWINHLFNQLPLVRIGLTTWSGNMRMIRVAEKLGMQMEARIRKVRYYQGEYYDSIRMGMLREEWEQHHYSTRRQVLK
ncbi:MULTISPECIES: GNAT family N-acetyltransferase [Oceanobacillus]|uniref:GNAT family N-acetyltransferase n=1 Tax=Oceanobacillus aidingensis TaxID=645964 RepID=A0ABV9JZI6_9BACI|nr:GNAT family protein [Oceanobacillus oncorhynchi]MDM8098546.1 GNAT family protein [Oceanobacillus oncorhynchi]UUI39004.1 GNAT family N-acetyltransferase [Oceanobacillus oncorhynchi]